MADIAASWGPGTNASWGTETASWGEEETRRRGRIVTEVEYDVPAEEVVALFFAVVIAPGG